MRSALFFLAVSSVFAANADFNGRWDIDVNNEARRRAWWLEVSGAETAAPLGKFISALGGDLNVIKDLSIKDGVLRFSFDRPANRKTAEPAAKLLYEARLVNGELVGEHTIAGRAGYKLEFRGKRAPVIAEKDGPQWKKGRVTELFNGKDLSNWSAMVPGKELGWAVTNGVMHNKAGANNLVSAEKFWNFELHCEFKIGEGSNGGLGLRGRYEVQILDDYGKPVNTHGAAALYSRVAPRINASKKPGEWQTYDIRLVGRQLTVVHNGEKVLDKVEVEGLTAMAHDWNEAVPGPISVQGDHGPVEIRKLTVTELVKK
jgi:hypothetical protein